MRNASGHQLRWLNLYIRDEAANYDDPIGLSFFFFAYARNIDTS